MSRFLCISYLLLCLPFAGQSQDFNELSEHSDESIRKEVKEWEQLIRVRDWKDASGQHEISAKFKRFDLGTNSIVLKKNNGNEITVQLLKLGDNERATAIRIAELRDSLVLELIEFFRKRTNEQKRKNDELAAAVDDRSLSYETEKKKLLSEIKRLSALVSSNALADDKGGIPLVTVKRMEVFGREYVDKQVKLTNCKFLRTSTTWVSKIGSDKEWAGFQVFDSENVQFQFAFARKDSFGEFLVSLKDGDKLNLSGTVVGPLFGSNYGIIVSKIEKIE